MAAKRTQVYHRVCQAVCFYRQPRITDHLCLTRISRALVSVFTYLVRIHLTHRRNFSCHMETNKQDAQILVTSLNFRMLGSLWRHKSLFQGSIEPSQRCREYSCFGWSFVDLRINVWQKLVNVIVCCRWFGCEWPYSIHVVEKLSQVLIESGGEYFGFVEFGIYLLKCSFLLS